MFNLNRQQLREFYREAWQKHCDKKPLEPLEKEVVAVLIDHPEYQAACTQEASSERQFHSELGEENPFWHLGLHLALREQVRNNRPNGIAKLYQDYCGKKIEPHEAEHAMMQCLAETLWQAQQNQSPPDEKDYLLALEEGLSDLS